MQLFPFTINFILFFKINFYWCMVDLQASLVAQC